MGKNYDAKLRAIAEFEQSMKDFAKQHGKTFGMATRVRKDILHAARSQPISEVLASLRQGLEEAILRPEEGTRLSANYSPVGDEPPTMH